MDVEVEASSRVAAPAAIELLLLLLLVKQQLSCHRRLGVSISIARGAGRSPIMPRERSILRERCSNEVEKKRGDEESLKEVN